MTDNRQLPPMSRGMQRFSILMFFLLGVALTAFLVGDPLGLFGRSSSSPAPSEQKVEEAAGEVGQVYMCPMHPEVIESNPGSCPICKMALVEVKQSPPEETGEREVLYWYAPMDPSYVQRRAGAVAHGDEAGAEIRRSRTRSGGIPVPSVWTRRRSRTWAWSARRLSRCEHRPVDPAERSGSWTSTRSVISWVNTKFAGWIEKVHVNYVGQTVRQGEPLFEIYSPELVTTQEEYLRALEYRGSLDSGRREQTIRQAESLLRSTASASVTGTSRGADPAPGVRRSVQRRL